MANPETIGGAAKDDYQTVFLVGFRMVAMIAFPSLAVSAWLIVRKHPKMFELWGLSLSQRSYYDPRKH